MRRPRSNFRSLKSERVKIFPKRFDKRLGEFVNRLSGFFRFVDNAVVNVGQIKNVRQIVAFEFQVTPQNVAERERAEIADVRETPNRRTANVKANLEATGFF